MNSENSLRELLASLDETELDGLIGGIDLPRNRREGRRIAERITRKEKITVKRNIKKKTAALIIAAAAALSCTAAAGAYVYDYFAHQKKNVTELTGDSQTAEMLESKGLLDTEQKKYDHFIVSKDTKVLFDGCSAKFAISLIPVDGQGRDMTSDVSFSFDYEIEPIDGKYKDVFTGMSCGYNYDDEFRGNIFKTSLVNYTEKIPVKLVIRDPVTNRVMAKVDYTFEKNLDTVDFADEQGRRIILSEMGVNCLDGIDLDWNFDRYAEDPGANEALKLVYKNGEEKTFIYRDFGHGCILGEDTDPDCIHSSYQFIHMIDPNEIRAIIIDGSRFEVK